MIDSNLVSKVMVMAIVISVILLFLGIVALIFIHVCIVARTFNRLSNGGGGGMIERGSNGSTSMSRDDVEKLPCYDYLAKSSPIECAVCLDNFKKGDKCRLLPICNHSFHSQCVDAWLLSNPNCPICRTTADSRRFSYIELNDIRIDDQLGQNQTNLVVTDHELGSNLDSSLEIV